ncbi:unnamed protein product [Heterosigma akashiwo]|uniref:Uncharacterized protein n=1 Tax=Heterosigma akashiwo TaxID=2829 RepID=A0A6V2SD86_HETAK|mmetsp:Transcript_23905/g.33016  ORF Transcript_23905/g.33016 Transcript_23905/m.33016 type:complete len:118 (+) Transcript_23905:46-399(+)
MSKGGMPFSLSELKDVELKHVDEPAESKVITAEAKISEYSEGEQIVIDRLEKMWERLDGNIEAVFSELEENPGKCLKYPPADKGEFARKYVRGFYTYSADAAAAGAKDVEAKADDKK